MTRQLFFIASIISIRCCGQSDTTSLPANKIILGVTAGSLVTITPKFLNNPNSYKKEKELFNFSTCGTIEKGKSFFAAGPVLSPHLGKKYDWDHNKEYGQYRLNGFHLLYQFNIRPKAKIFNSFFQCQFIYLYHKNNGEVSKFIPYAGWGNFEYTSNWNVIDFFISYGLKVKFSKNFYISPNAGIGFIIDREYVYYEPGDSRFNYDYWDARTSLIVSLSMGYKFDCKK